MKLYLMKNYFNRYIRCGFYLLHVERVLLIKDEIAYSAQGILPFDSSFNTAQPTTNKHNFILHQTLIVQAQQPSRFIFVT